MSQSGRPMRKSRYTAVVLLVVAMAAGLFVAVTSGAIGASRGPASDPDSTFADAPLQAEADCPSRNDSLRPGEHRGLTATTASRWAKAKAAAKSDGVTLTLTSGWRSYNRQQELFDCAVEREGTKAKARRWVLPPKESQHVEGKALDVGPPSGAAWLEKHGAKYGLCRRYDNEPWHFEPAMSKPGGVCPAREAHA